MPSEAELVAAIYEHPDDLAARSVYGDWLAERGDPRGELIALQLGRSDAPAARRRERELIRAYHETWVGGLGYWFEPAGRVFEDGMFAGGVLHVVGEPVDLARMLRDPMWRLVRRIELRNSHSDALVLALLDRPELVSLRAVYGLSEACAEELATGRERPLTALGWRIRDLARMGKPLATLPALPALRELAPMVPYATGAEHWFGDAPVLERVERLLVPSLGELTQILRVLATRGGALREVRLLEWNRPVYADDGWQIRLTRTAAPGPFTTIAASHRVSPTQNAWFASGLAVLSRVPAEWVSELAVDAERVPLLTGHDRTQLRALTDRFPHATKHVPWEVEGAPDAAGLTLHVRLEGTGLLGQVRALWPILIHQLGQRYTTLRTNHNATERPLGKQPLERVVGWADKPATSRLVLVRDGRESTVELHRGDGVIESLVLEVNDRSLDDIAAALGRIIELGTFRRGRCGIGFIDAHANDFVIPELEKVPEAGWLIVFGPEYVPVLPLESVAALARDPLLGGMHVIPAHGHLIVALARTPDEISRERLRAAARGLHAILTRHTIKRLGFDIREHAIDVLAGPAALVDLEAVIDPERPLSQRFAHRKQPAHRLYVAVERAPVAPTLVCALQIVDGDRIATRRVLATELLTDRTSLDAVLTNVGRRVVAEAITWFAANG